jgi:hypothetical protein
MELSQVTETIALKLHPDALQGVSALAELEPGFDGDS